MNFSPFKIAKKAIPSRYKTALKARRFNGEWRMNTPDRRILERKILPYFAAQADVRDVLDVGCDWYTSSYPSLFPSQNYCSIDIRPEQSRFARSRHLTGSLLDLDTHFNAGAFDLIIINGVFGWGINGQSDLKRAMSQIEHALRPGGYMVAGWNDIPEYCPKPIDTILEAPSFEPFPVAELGGSEIDTPTTYRHQYRLFRRVGD